MAEASHVREASPEGRRKGLSVSLDTGSIESVVDEVAVSLAPNQSRVSQHSQVL
jgi:hypothetical protein